MIVLIFIFFTFLTSILSATALIGLFEGSRFLIVILEKPRLEDVPFECRFDRGALKQGTNNIRVKAQFNFETLGYLKTYFMDIERMRALRRENTDPLKQYGINE